MSDQPNVEQRLATLEKAVAEIQSQLKTHPVAPDWIERISGSMKDKPEFLEVLEYGRQFRQVDRPKDEEVLE